MIEVKLTFASQAELLAFFAGNRNLVSAGEKTAVANISAGKQEANKPGKPAGPASTPTAPAAQPATTTTAAGSPSEGKSDAATAAEGQQSAASTAASSASSTGGAIEYPVLQKAVFALAGKNKAAAQELCAKFGVRTFKDLDSARWGEALAAVNAALAG